MASRFDENQTSHPLDTFAKQIEDTLDKLILHILTRKQNLFVELNNHRIEYDNIIVSKLQTEKELISLKQQVEDLNRNELKSMQDNILSNIEENLDKLTLSANSFKLDFQIDTHSIEQEINKLGRFVRASELQVANYSAMKIPIVAVGKNGAGREQINGPRGIAFEEKSEFIFICDSSNSCIKIFNSAGDFIDSFGSSQLVEPWGILLHRSSIYVADINKCAILKYQRTDYDFLVSKGQKGSDRGEFKCPMQLAIGPDGCLYVPEDVNNRISVLDTELNLKRYIKHTNVVQPVGVKCTKHLFVLCAESVDRVHLFNLHGNYIKCVIRMDSDVHSYFFTVDAIENILVSCLDGRVRVYNDIGIFLHSIGKEGYNKGELVSPSGICTARSKNLIVVSCSKKFGLQIF